MIMRNKPIDNAYIVLSNCLKFYNIIGKSYVNMDNGLDLKLHNIIILRTDM